MGVDLAEHGTEMRVTAGSKLLLDGPFPQALVLIKDGRGRVRHAGETVAELGPGDLFGELAPHRPSYTAATVTAISDLTVVMFSSRQVKLLGKVAPALVASLLGTGYLPSPPPVTPHLQLVKSA
ncbi:MAG: family transcriptional regulator, cyclic receptor protein [Solirubrobacteraceae bacterium]|jgi:CRP-like cAMP-binding protein|nr:family transcriptional regulator, cyclic receptor protein [Solirubrobacteraceae bacterium]